MIDTSAATTALAGATPPAGASPFQFKIDMSAAQANSVGGGRVETGTYKIKLNHVSYKQDKSGNNRADISLETTHELVVNEGGHTWAPSTKKTMIFGLCIQEKWNSGSVNYDYAKWNELALILGMQTGALQAMTVGTGAEQKTIQVFSETVNKECTMALQLVHGVYQDKETIDTALVKSYLGEQSVTENLNNLPAQEMLKVQSGLEDYYTAEYNDWKSASSAGAPATAPATAPSTAPTGAETPKRLF